MEYDNTFEDNTTFGVSFRDAFINLVNNMNLQNRDLINVLTSENFLDKYDYGFSELLDPYKIDWLTSALRNYDQMYTNDRYTWLCRTLNRFITSDPIPPNRNPWNNRASQGGS